MARALVVGVSIADACVMQVSDLAEGQDLFAQAPWVTGCGRAFVAKLAFVAVVLAFGGYNRQRVVPAIG